MAEKKSFQGFSGSTLKIIAIVTMLIDHFGYLIIEKGVIIPWLTMGGNEVWQDPKFISMYNFLMLLRTIGRLAFPIFCFLLVEGFLHTSNRKKYAIRLGVFSLVSEIPFNLGCTGNLFDFAYQNVFFTLFIGLLVIWILEKLEGKIILQVLVIAIGGLIAYLLKTDYDWNGIVIICAFYLFRKNKTARNIAVALSLYFELPAIFALIPIHYYNGKRGISMKYFFYLFYPVHILILYFIRVLIFKTP